MKRTSPVDPHSGTVLRDELDVSILTGLTGTPVAAFAGYHKFGMAPGIPAR